MIRAIDHVVILVRDLAAAIADYTALGFTVTPGGEHTGGATHNALVIFADDSYLELIAFKRPAPEDHWYRQLAIGEGIIDFALLPTAIEADLAAARERGLAIEGPIAGGRLRPDGQQVAWQTGQAATQDLPFLCGDVTPRSLRVPGGAARVHANGVGGIAGLTVAVADLGASISRYRALLGMAEREASPSAELDRARQASFALGDTTITLAAPEPGAATPLAERLAGVGEGPFALVLRGARRDQALDLTLAHGARMSLVDE
ncbi:MAG TPA: VOC family protein [Roseiflexaceae bacterium]|nr:VOC family protein [Roseiflexaceae bacterium]